jgi:hypothetical protein
MHKVRKIGRVLVLLAFIEKAYGDIWNSGGDFELSLFDTGWMEYVDFVSAPWGGNSWGLHCYMVNVNVLPGTIRLLGLFLHTESKLIFPLIIDLIK